MLLLVPFVELSLVTNDAMLICIKALFFLFIVNELTVNSWKKGKQRCFKKSVGLNLGIVSLEAS